MAISPNAALRLKLSAILTAITVLVMGTFGFLLTTHVGQIGTEGAIRQLKETNELVHNMIATYNGSFKEAADNLGRLFAARLPGPYALHPVAGSQRVPDLVARDRVLNDAQPLVTRFSEENGGDPVEILVAAGEQFVRVASSLRSDGPGLVGTSLDANHPAYAPLRAGETYLGRESIRGREFMVRYQPLRDTGGRVVGALFAGIDLTNSLARLKHYIRSVRIGESGYVYVLDGRDGPSQGTLLVHPAQEGRNIADARDAGGRQFIREILARREGVIAYPWVNPELGETAPREKVAAYREFKEWQWVIGSGSYLDELMKLAADVRSLTVWAAVAVTLVIILTLNWAVGRWVITPLIGLQNVLREAEERWSFALEGAGDGVWDWDKRSGGVYYSLRWKEMLGYADHEVAGRIEEWTWRVHPEDAPQVEQALEKHFSGADSHYHCEHRVRCRDDGYKWVLGRGKVVSWSAEGKPLRVIGTQTDISERKQAEGELSLWAKVFEGSAEGIMITDGDNRILSVNAAFIATTGYSAAEMRGQTPSILKSGRQDEAFYRDMWNALQQVGYWQGEIWNRRKNGEIYPEWLCISALKGAGGRIVNYIGMFSDISEQKSAEARIDYLVNHDPLTGLPNRVLLHDRLGMALAQAARKRAQVAVVCLDLDRFKTINDSLGHHAGDHVLQTVAERIQTAVRGADTVCRMGGDEFFVILPEVRAASDVAGIVRGLMDCIASPCLVDGMELHLTASVGVSLFPGDGRDGETLIRNAEAAMHMATERGRDSYQFYTDELNARVSERLMLENSLRRAIERDELFLLYQPQLLLKSGEVKGVEALIRWSHPELGLISPAKFVPLAEETGLIVPIGEWVLREACRQQRAWMAAGLPPLVVAVNISAVQFRHADFRQSVAEIIRETGIDPSCLELEVTEGVVMGDGAEAAAGLGELKGLGVKLAIDDFGTGYSSMSYLQRFPVDCLKIDQSFVRAMEGTHTGDAIVKAIIALGHALGVRLVAEGVETEHQLTRLRHWECNEVQGYLVSRPVPPEEVLAWVKKRVEAAESVS